MMKFALLGDDLQAVPFLAALGGSLQWLAQAPQCGNNLPGVERCDSWAEFLRREGPDAVIIAGSDPAVLEGARQLAAAGKPLLIWPAPRQSSAFIYELTLIHADREVLLFPLLALRGQQQIRELSSRLARGEIGEVQHLRLERTAPLDEGHLRWTVVEQQLLGDIDVMRSLGGEYDQITASRSGDPAASISFVSVTLSGEGRPQALCSVVPGSSAAWRLTATGAAGTLTLSCDGDPLLVEGRIEQTSTADRAPVVSRAANASDDGTTDDWPAWLMRRFLEAHGGAAIRPNWTDLSRDFELLEAIGRSLTRRRTIDVYFETPSERSTFKSQMTAVGCSLLMLTLGAAVVYLAVAAAFPLPKVVQHVLRGVIFAPLGLFLLLQLLIFIARPSKKKSGG